MEKKIAVGSVSKPSPEELLAMYEKLDTQLKEIKAQFKRGVLSPRHVQALIEHRNPFSSFPVWRTIKIGTGLKTADDFRKALKYSGNKISGYVNDFLEKIKAATEETEVDLCRPTVAELTGKEEIATTAEVFAGAKHLGLEKCPAEVGP